MHRLADTSVRLILVTLVAVVVAVASLLPRATAGTTVYAVAGLGGSAEDESVVRFQVGVDSAAQEYVSESAAGTGEGHIIVDGGTLPPRVVWSSSNTLDVFAVDSDHASAAAATAAVETLQDNTLATAQMAVEEVDAGTNQVWTLSPGSGLFHFPVSGAPAPTRVSWASHNCGGLTESQLFAKAPGFSAFDFATPRPSNSRGRILFWQGVGSSMWTFPHELVRCDVPDGTNPASTQPKEILFSTTSIPSASSGHPAEIAWDAEDGIVFFTSRDAGLAMEGVAMIDISGFSGSAITAHTHVYDTGGGTQPRSIALDETADVVYLMLRADTTVVRFNYDGSGVQTLFSISGVEAMAMTLYKQADCSDGVLNQEETDIDCGGASCAACAAGKSCAVDLDCDASLCMGGVCSVPSLHLDVDPEGLGECSAGHVLVAEAVHSQQAVGVSDPVVSLRLVASEHGAAAAVPLSVSKQGAGAARVLALQKQALGGWYDFDILATDARGQTVTLTKRLIVACPSADEGDNSTSTALFHATLRGFTSSQWAAGASNSSTSLVGQLRTVVRESLGVDLGAVTFLGTDDDANGDAVVTCSVQVPVTALPSDKRVAIALDASSVANKTPTTQLVALRHLGRVLSRSLDVCCNGTLVDVP